MFSLPTKSQLFARHAGILTAVLLLAVCMVGCRAPAQREVYSTRMANEIRILEDQLYDADYQNRVLKDELQRVKAACEPSGEVVAPQSEPSTFPTHDDRSIPLPYHPPVDSVPLSDHTSPAPLVDEAFPSDSFAPPPYAPYDSGFTPDYNAPVDSAPINNGTFSGDTIFDEATTPPPAPTVVPLPSGSRNAADTNAANSNTATENIPSDTARRESDPRSTGPDFGNSGSNNPGSGFGNLPAPFDNLPPPPAVAEPPSTADPRIPDVEPGPIKAPSFPGLDPGGPDGRIEVPELDAIRYSKPTVQQHAMPNHIRLHTSLSGGHQFDRDDAVDGLYVVVYVVDENGRTLNLNNYDIQAGMTIVALDPKLDPTASRIGRWEFTPEEVSKYIRSIPVAGLHVPVKWKEIEPIGDEIVVHVRLQTEGEEMQCQGKIKLNQAAAMAKWMPRGETLER